MIKLEFTEAEKQSLHYERYPHPHPRVQRQMEALWLVRVGVLVTKERLSFKTVHATFTAHGS
jgi:hypothetical protein